MKKRRLSAGAGSSNQGEIAGVEVKAVLGPVLSPKEALVLALSRPQLMAIEKMLTGHTLVAAATAAGVTRMTLYNWLHHDAKFQAAYNAWQLDAITSVRTRVLSMGEDAAATLGRAVRTDPWIAAMVVKALGGLDRPTPGATDPEEVAELAGIERKKAEAKREEELLWASLGGRPGAGKRKKSAKEMEAEAEVLIGAYEREMGKR
jgi:hypothetical protein